MNRATVRKLYRDAIVQTFGCGDKEIDAQLLKAVMTDVHYGHSAPGGWTNNSELEIYCENGIPNASDVNDFSDDCQEFGIPYAGPVIYNSDSWSTVDDLVNLMLEAMGKSERFYHEPYSHSVVGVWKV